MQNVPFFDIMPKFRLNIGTFVGTFVLSGVAGGVYMIFC